MPVLGEERAKLGNGDLEPEIDLEAEEYEVIITVPDNPGMILYQSDGTDLAARNSYLIAIFDADASIAGNISVRALTSNGLSLELPDTNVLPTLRTVHASIGTANFDIYRDLDFTAPIFSDLGFGQSTGDVLVAEGTVAYTYTAVGEPGMVFDEQDQTISAGARISTIVTGLDVTELMRSSLIDDRRSVETHAKLRIIHTALNFPILNLYLVPTGTDITEENPILAGMPVGFLSSFSPTLANTYDLILTLPDDKTPLAMFSPVDLSDGDVAEVIILDTIDPLVPGILETRF